jgi:hypothetical protein
VGPFSGRTSSPPVGGLETSPNWARALSHSERWRTDSARSDPYPGKWWLAVGIRPEADISGRTPRSHPLSRAKEKLMSNIVYIVGVIVIVVALLSFFGLR